MTPKGLVSMQPQLICSCGTCRTCRHREANRRWKVRNRQAIRDKAAADREANREEIRAYNRQWSQANRAKHNAYAQRWRERNPEKLAAQTAAGNAIRDGRLVRQPCEVCGSEPSQAHHPDYSKPLDVRWLCVKHHGELHRKG